MGREIWTGEARKIRQFAMALGYSVGRTGKCHIKCTHPKIKKPVFIGGTISDCRGYKNARSMLERMLKNAETKTPIT